MISEEELKTHLDSIKSYILAKSSVVPLIASLSATILVVATFNEQLLKITPYFKIALSVLLLLIPVSLFIYLVEFHLAIKNGKKIIEDLVGCKDLLSNQTLLFGNTFNKGFRYSSPVPLPYTKMKINLCHGQQTPVVEPCKVRFTAGQEN